VADINQHLVKILRWSHEAAFAKNRLGNDRGYVFGSDYAFERVFQMARTK
jgi:hypothetical protein